MKNIVSIFLLAVTLSGVATWRLNIYGRAHNDERKQLGIPVVEVDWQAHYSRTNGVVYFFGKNVYGLGHVKKIIYVNYLTGIKQESDLFVFKNATIDISYIYGRKSPWQIAYYSKGKRLTLTYKQAVDSLAILKKKP